MPNIPFPKWESTLLAKTTQHEERRVGGGINYFFTDRVSTFTGTSAALNMHVRPLIVSAGLAYHF